MTIESAIALIIAGVVAGGGVVFGFPKARSEWLSGTRSLVDLQANTIQKLQEKVEEFERQIGELRDHIRHLETAYLSSRLCARASRCPNYTAVPDFMAEAEKETT